MSSLPLCGPSLVDDENFQYIDISIETMIYLEMTQSVSKKGDFLCRKRQQVTNNSIYTKENPQEILEYLYSSW